MSVVNEGHEQGVLEEDEAEMISNIVELGEKEAGDIMVHRKKLVALDGEDTLKNAVDFILNKGVNSRYPVYVGDVDTIIGILTLKDAIIYARNPENEKKALKDIPGLLRKAHFIPETRSLDDLFREMQSQKKQMVIVVDEYGQTAGIVTLEDIIEEIVGEIQDEYDKEEKNIKVNSDGSYIMKGLTPLDEIEEETEIRFTEEEKEYFDTLNGLLIAEHEQVPMDGEKFTLVTHGYRFEALSVKDRIIRTVKVTKENA